MADNIDVTAGTGTTIATDQVGTAHFQKVKLVDGTAESTTVIAAGGGVEAGALRVTLASDGTGVVSVDDNGSSLTVDGSVTASLAAGTNNIGDVDVLSIAAGDNNIGNVDIASAIPAGTNLIGKVGIDQVTANANEVVVKSGTVTAVTGITNVVHVDDNSSTLSVDDGAGSLTVDGTVAATQSGTWNVGTLSTVTNVVHVDDNSSTLSIDDGAGSITVDGSVTAALGTTDAGNLTDIKTAVEIIDNAINGSEMQVDVVGALPAGTNNIGDVDVLSIAAGDNNIGNFDVVTMPVGGYCASSDLTSACTTDITTATATEVLAAPGSGKYFHLTSVLVTNGDADTGTFVNLYDTTDGTGTVKWTGYAASAGGGFSVSLPAPINWGDNKPVWAKCESSDATVRVSIAGFIK